MGLGDFKDIILSGYMPTGEQTNKQINKQHVKRILAVIFLALEEHKQYVKRILAVIFLPLDEDIVEGL